MEPDHPEMQAMLKQALEKAESLVQKLRQQQAEVEANPPNLPPKQLAAGREALSNAIAAAERTMAALHAAGLSAQADTN